MRSTFHQAVLWEILQNQPGTGIASYSRMRITVAADSLADSWGPIVIISSVEALLMDELTHEIDDLNDPFGALDKCEIRFRYVIEDSLTRSEALPSSSLLFIAS